MAHNNAFGDSYVAHRPLVPASAPSPVPYHDMHSVIWRRHAMYIQAVTDGFLHHRFGPHTIARLDQPQRAPGTGKAHPAGGRAGTLAERPAGDAVQREIPTAPRCTTRQEI